MRRDGSGHGCKLEGTVFLLQGLAVERVLATFGRSDHDSVGGGEKEQVGLRKIGGREA